MFLQFKRALFPLRNYCNTVFRFVKGVFKNFLTVFYATRSKVDKELKLLYNSKILYYVILRSIIMAEEVILTKEGKEELEKRLEYLKFEKRKEITERIKVAREFGDLSENAEYDAAKNEQAMIEGEILEIENKLKYAVIIKDEGKNGIVSLGSKVDFVMADDDSEVDTYEIVGTTEADVEAGRISNESPIGNALLGRKKGDRVSVATPSGVIEIIVKKVY